MPCKRFIDSDYTLQILLSMGINYPVLKDIYPVLSKPLFVILPSGSVEAAINILADKNTPKLSSNLNFKGLNEVLNSVNSDFAVYHFMQTKKGTDFLELILNAVVTGSQDGNNFGALPVVVSENIPFGFDLNNFFIIFFDDKFTGSSFNRMAVVPPEPENDLPVILDKFHHVTADSTHDEKALLAAACFLYPFYRDNGLEQAFPALLDFAKKLAELDEDNHSTENAYDFFIPGLYKWQRETSFNAVCELPNIGIETEKHLDDYIFFNNKYIYINEKFFKKIISSFLGTSHLPLMKALVSEGILCPDSTYTAKMFYYNIAGNACRKHMLRFSREKLTQTGEAGFIEICQNTKKDI